MTVVPPLPSSMSTAGRVPGKLGNVMRSYTQPLLAALMTAGAAGSAAVVRTRAEGEGRERRIVTNLQDARTGGYMVIGPRNARALATVSTPYPMHFETCPEPPFPTEQTVRVSSGLGRTYADLPLKDYVWRDDVCRIDVPHAGVYCIQAENAWVRHNDTLVRSVPGQASLYLLAVETGDRVCFRSKGWTPRVLRLCYNGKEPPSATFPLRATTATEFDYQGTLRLLTGELNAVKFAICRRTREDIDPAAFRLVLEAPSAFLDVSAHGRGSKLRPLSRYAVTSMPVPLGSRRHTVALRPFLTELQDFLQRHPGYPQADYIGWASVFVTFRLPPEPTGDCASLRWWLEGPDGPSEVHSLRVETYSLAQQCRKPNNFGVHMSAGSLPAIAAEGVWRGFGTLLGRCGITAVITSDPEAARRMRETGLRTLFFGSYNNGFGGVDIHGKPGRICPQKHLLDHGVYFGKRLFETGERAHAAYDGYELDFEPRGANPHLACFCRDCRKAFGARVGPEVANLPPAEIWRTHRDAWIAFRNWQYAEVFRTYAEAVRAIHPAYQVCINAGGGAISGEDGLRHMREADGWRLGDISRHVDLYSPYFYHNSEAFIPSFRFQHRHVDRSRLAPWTASSFGVGSTSHTLSVATLRQQMFIWFAMGAPAFRIWNENETGMDGLRLLTVRKTLDELVACEPYYARGRPADDIVTLSGHCVARSGPGTRVGRDFRPWSEIVQCCAHRLGDAVAVTLLNLDPDGEDLAVRVRVALALDGPGPFTVDNLLTGAGAAPESRSREAFANGFEVEVEPKGVMVVVARSVKR